MSKRLRDNLTSDYFGAANRLNSRQQRKKIIAYVESYDDVFFWRSILSQFETDSYYFEIMLPTRQNVLERGKKAALMSALSGKTGQWLIEHVTEEGIAPVAKIMVAKNELDKKKLANSKMTDEQYQKELTELKNGNLPTEKVPTLTIIIKALDTASYKNMVDALDEMQICSISTSSGSMASGSMEMDLTWRSPATTAVTMPPPALASTVSSAAWAWISSIFFCIFLACFIMAWGFIAIAFSYLGAPRAGLMRCGLLSHRLRCRP